MPGPKRERSPVVTIDDHDAVARAEEALALLSSQFATWMDEECERLDAARGHVHAAGLNEATCEALFRAAHDIKGEAATFGYPAIEVLAASLCRLIENTRDKSRIPLRLVDGHVDAMRVIARQKARDESADVVAGLTSEIIRATAEFLVREDVTALADLDGIASPPLAP